MENPDQVRSKSRFHLTKRKLIIALIGASLALLSISIYLASKKSPTPPVPAPTPPPKALDLETKTWPEYKSEVAPLAFKYPPQAQIIKRENETTVRYTGQTQGSDPELHDAISISFSVKKIEGSKSLREIVQEDMQRIKDSPAQEVITQIEQVTINNINGYKFKSKGMGEFSHIYLPIDEESYLKITDGTIDPADQGFDQVVKKILNTITISSD